MSEALHFTLRLPAHPVSVATARGVVRSLHPVLRDDHLQRAELIISELVTNAIRHGSRRGAAVDLEMTASRSGLEGCVSDTGPAFSAPTTTPAHDQVGGFGLHIVDRLATTWEVRHSSAGNAVSFVVR